MLFLYKISSAKVVGDINRDIAYILSGGTDMGLLSASCDLPNSGFHPASTPITPGREWTVEYDDSLTVFDYPRLTMWRPHHADPLEKVWMGLFKYSNGNGIGWAGLTNGAAGAWTGYTRPYNFNTSGTGAGEDWYVGDVLEIICNDYLVAFTGPDRTTDFYAECDWLMPDPPAFTCGRTVLTHTGGCDMRVRRGGSWASNYDISYAHKAGRNMGARSSDAGAYTGTITDYYGNAATINPKPALITPDDGFPVTMEARGFVHAMDTNARNLGLVTMNGWNGHNLMSVMIIWAQISTSNRSYGYVEI